MDSSHLKKRLLTFLTKPVGALNLSILRFGFGSLMIIMLYKYIGFVDVFWLPESAIPFQGLEFIRPLSPENMKLVIYFGMVAAFFTAIGFFFRYSCFFLTVVLLYSVLMTRVVFNNHYYLFALISLLFIFTNADERFSIKSLFRKKPPRKIPFWQYFILQLQVFIVFFIGGISKINPDWLSGAVMDPMIWSAFGMFDELHMVSLGFSWIGMLFDLSIGFFLFWKRTRFWAVLMVVIFNLMNGLLLFDNIGLFPYAMIVITILLFLNPSYLDAKFKKLNFSSLSKIKEKGLVTLPFKNLWIPLLMVHFLFQIAYPFRHIVTSGNPDWTDQGSTFAWRMKSNSKIVKLQFKAIERATGKFVSDVNMGFTFKQEQLYAYSPYSVWFMAQRVQKRFIEKGRSDLGVIADYYVTMNGQPMQRAILPGIDLSAVDYSRFKQNKWIIPWERKSRSEIETLQQEVLDNLKN